MPVVFGNKQLQHAVERLGNKKVGLGLAAIQGSICSEPCAMGTMQCYMYLRNKQNNFHIGAMLLVRLTSMLAGLSEYNDTDSRASSTDSVPLTHQSPHTPAREENMGSPCKHDWLLAKQK